MSQDRNALSREYKNTPRVVGVEVADTLPPRDNPDDDLRALKAFVAGAARPVRPSGLQPPLKL
jgi:hypothetical protein